MTLRYDDITELLKHEWEAPDDLTTTIMCGAIRGIDYVFGAGYAKQHPELVGTFMVADAHSDISRGLQDIRNALGKLAEAQDNVAHALHRLGRGTDFSEGAIDLLTNAIANGLSELKNK